MNCPICNKVSKNYKEVNGYSSELCTWCGHIFVTNPPEENKLSDYYDKSFYENYMSGMGYDAAFHKVLKQDFEKKISLISSILPQGSKILEVGAGPGYFAEMLQNEGYSVTAVELNSSALEYAKKHGKGKIKFIHENISNRDCSIYGKEFDAVISWAVIEHIKDVNSFIKLLKSYTCKNGFVFLDTGITGKIVRFLDNGYTSWLFPPLHLHVFSKKSLKKLYMLNNLKLYKYFPFFNYFSNYKYDKLKTMIYCLFAFIKTIKKPFRIKNKPGTINNISLFILKK